MEDKRKIPEQDNYIPEITKNLFIFLMLMDI